VDRGGRQLLPPWLPAYFRYGNSARHFDKIMGYARMRLVTFTASRHRRSRGSGWIVITYLSPDYVGLINLDGTVAAPRLFRAWRGQTECRR
jgi:RNA-directed DNA polymerase